MTDPLQEHLLMYAQGRLEAPMTTTYDTLVLGHNGGEWQGTFGVMLKALIDDLLTDDPPADVTVTFDGARGTSEVGGAPVSRTDTELYLTGDIVVSLDSVLSITVP